MNMLTRAGRGLSAFLGAALLVQPVAAQEAQTLPKAFSLPLTGNEIQSVGVPSGACSAANAAVGSCGYGFQAITIGQQSAYTLGTAIPALPAAAALTGAEVSNAIQNGSAVKTSLTQIYNANPFRLRALSSRDTVLGNGNPAGNSTVTGATYRAWFSTPVSADVSDPSWALANWAMTQTGEVVGPNAITAKCSLEYGAAWYPLYIGGQRTVTIQPGATMYTDPLSITLNRNTPGWVRCFVTNNGTGGTWFIGHNALIIGGSYDNNNYAAGTNADLTDATGSISGGAPTASFHPIAMFGRLSTPLPVVGILGDSISRGTGDAPTNSQITSPYMGFLERALGNTVPWVHAGQAAYRSQYIVPPLARAMELFTRNGVSTVIDELGVNDLPFGLSTLQTSQLQVWGLLKARGIRVVKTTITPSQVTSTDGWTTLANQTTANATYESTRVSFNTWIRCGAPIVSGAAVACGTTGAILAGQAAHPLAGYIEEADTVEARNSGKWNLAATARSVTDAAISSTTNTTTVSSATANFTSADLGTKVWIVGAGASGAGLSAQIQSVAADGKSATIGVAAGTTVSGAAMNIGGITDDGLHPATAGHLLMAVPVQNALTSGLIN